jgi:hypothetical protein
VTSIVDAIRNVLTQQPVGTDLWTALARCVGILVVAYVSAMIAFQHRIFQVAVEGWASPGRGTVTTARDRKTSAM